jgi:hypothetical protein
LLLFCTQQAHKSLGVIFKGQFPDEQHLRPIFQIISVLRLTLAPLVNELQVSKVFCWEGFTLRRLEWLHHFLGLEIIIADFSYDEMRRGKVVEGINNKNVN